MSKYKVGDRVKIVRSPFCGESRRAGAVGTISRVPSRIRGEVEIEFKDDTGPWGFHFDEIEHVGYKPVPGDRVRVVLEGEVDWFGPKSGNFEIGGHHIDVSSSNEHIVSVEKIEPPVEVFKPGDVVRSIEYPKHVYTLGSGGYYSHRMEKFYEPGCAFTSAEYELVHRP